MPESALAIRVMFMPLYFMSGVIFPLSMVPRELLPWLMWNPVLHFVELARAAFFRDYILPPGISLTYVLIVPAVSLYIGFQFYYLRRFRLAQR
jgi:capsular polysaccharide transport system permease protein